VNDKLNDMLIKEIHELRNLHDSLEYMSIRKIDAKLTRIISNLETVSGHISAEIDNIDLV